MKQEQIKYPGLNPLPPPFVKEFPPLAVVVEEKCIACDRCPPLCFFDTIVMEARPAHPYKRTAVVIPDNCTGCGLCFEACPVDAFVWVPDQGSGSVPARAAGTSERESASWIKAHGGLAIASHIDSTTFSIISQLGFIPEHIELDALEVRNIDGADEFTPFIMKKGIPFVTFSDAHYPGDIGRRRTVLALDAPDCRGIEKALKILGERALTAGQG